MTQHQNIHCLFASTKRYPHQEQSYQACTLAHGQRSVGKDWEKSNTYTRLTNHRKKFFTIYISIISKHLYALTGHIPDHVLMPHPSITYRNLQSGPMQLRHLLSTHLRTLCISAKANTFRVHIPITSRQVNSANSPTALTLGKYFYVIFAIGFSSSLSDSLLNGK